MPIWIADSLFPLGAAFIVAAFWKQDEQSTGFDPERPKALVWGVAMIAIALDAAIFGYLPTWGE